MRIAASSLDRKLTFYRRENLVAGVTESSPRRGGYAEYGDAWVGYADRGEEPTTLAGVEFKLRRGTVVLRDNTWARTLTTTDRVVIDGDDFAIKSVAPQSKSEGARKLFVEQVLTPLLAAQHLEAEGVILTVTRPKPSPAVNRSVRAIVRGYRPEELAGGIQQGDSEVLISPLSLLGSSWVPERPKPGDRITVDGRDRSVESVNAVRAGGEVVLYSVQVR